MSADKTFFERWALRPVDTRDREFYLAALPLTVMIVGLAPHVFRLVFVPGDVGELLKLSGQVALGAIMIGIICYSLTRWLSSPRWWGPQRHRWPLAKHLLLLWTPTALLVDTPLRLSELAMINPGRQSAGVITYVFGVSLGRAFLFSGGIVFYERLLGAVQEAATQRQRALWLETQTLKNLIQPHFLLNSLNAVRAYIEDSPKVAEETLLRLTSLLRRVIQYSSAEKITIASEIDVIKDYVALMNRRYELDVRLDLDGAQNAPVRIPPLILFSLVENSFKHGFSGRKNGRIRLAIETSDRLRLIVNDDGAADESASSGGGLGGQYVQARLELLYGDDFAFRHGRLDDGHYEAVIEIPWDKA